MIQFKVKTSLQNGNKLNKRNWETAVAVSSIPCTNILGVPEIERQKALNGMYYERWELKKEKDGYIFREINHGCGIGVYKTYRQAVFAAAKHSHITVTIP